MTTNTATKFRLGQVIRYHDMCNDSTFVVIDVDAECPWSTYTLRNVETFEVTKTDGRQCGWELVAA